MQTAAQTLLQGNVLWDWKAYLENLPEVPQTVEELVNHLEGFLMNYQDGR